MTYGHHRTGPRTITPVAAPITRTRYTPEQVAWIKAQPWPEYSFLAMARRFFREFGRDVSPSGIRRVYLSDPK